MTGGEDKFTARLFDEDRVLKKLIEAMPEMEREHNLCIEIINEYRFEGASRLEAKAFDAAGSIAQTLGAILGMLDDFKEDTK